MQLPFIKMHGIGNDFVMVDAYSEQNRSRFDLSRRYAAHLCDRKFGVGSDGVIVILPAPDPSLADFQMLMYNPDGSESEMCGNGLRCFAKYVVDQGYTKSDIQRILTGRGVLTTKTFQGQSGEGVVSVQVNMGAPILKPSDVPVAIATENNDPVVGYELCVDGQPYKITCVSMGNPHCVVFVDDDPDTLPLSVIGPKFEHHPAFPKRINTEFVQVLPGDEFKMRVWERGAGETLACGTGACAVAVACVLNGKTGRLLTGHLAGGDLRLNWTEQGDVLMDGSATEVFTGIAELPEGD